MLTEVSESQEGGWDSEGAGKILQKITEDKEKQDGGKDVVKWRQMWMCMTIMEVVKVWGTDDIKGG